MTFLRIALAALALFAAVPALAQEPTPAAEPKQDCVVLPDTFRGPTPGQIADRQKLRMQLDSIGRAFGVAEPKGLLLVDVDTARKGLLLFLDSNYPPEGVETAKHFVEAYLSTLPPRRPFQALIRVDGEFPALAPGKRQCRPEIINFAEHYDMLRELGARHPRAGKLAQASNRVVTLLLVVNRDGGVSFVASDPTGDDYIDQGVLEIGKKLRFVPARLDGMPYDVRYRYRMTLRVP